MFQTISRALAFPMSPAKRTTWDAMISKRLFFNVKSLYSQLVPSLDIKQHRRPLPGVSQYKERPLESAHARMNTHIKSVLCVCVGERAGSERERDRERRVCVEHEYSKAYTFLKAQSYKRYSTSLSFDTPTNLKTFC